MTAKEQLERAVARLTEDEAADVLQLLAQPRSVDEDAVTEFADSIPGALEDAQRGLEDVRAGRTVTLDDLRHRAEP